MPSDSSVNEQHTVNGASRRNAAQEMPDELRSDVRLLGDLLGQVLVDAGSENLLEDVEQLRELTIQAYTEPGMGAFAQAEKLVAAFTLDRAEEVARAFTCYFHLANLAEEAHRVRVLQSRGGEVKRVQKTRSPEP